MTQEARDFILAHAAEYDPAKRREYYLRTRKLKGRPKGGRQPAPKGKPSPFDSAKLKARRKARLQALQTRLKKLEQELEILVQQAKERSGVSRSEDPTRKKTPTQSKTSTKGSGGSERKLTAKEKRDAAQRSKEYREKNPQKTETEQIEAKIRAVREKIAEMKAQIAEAKRKRARQTDRRAAKPSRTPSASGR